MSCEIIDWFYVSGGALKVLYDADKDNVWFEEMNYIKPEINYKASDNFVMMFRMAFRDNEIKVCNLKNGYVSVIVVEPKSFFIKITGYSILDYFEWQENEDSVYLPITERLAELIIRKHDRVSLFLRRSVTFDNRVLINEVV